MKVWIINPFDPIPGDTLRPGRYSFLCRMLSENGYRVTWWSSNFFHMNKTYRFGDHKEISINNNIKIVCLNTPRYKSNISLKRVLNHLIYAYRFYSEAYNSFENPDIIIASVPPLFSAKMSIRIARKIGAKCVIDIQDLWPDFFEALFPNKVKFLSKIILYPIKIVADSIYKNSDAITGVSITCINRALLNSLYKKHLFVPIGIDFDYYKKIEESYSNSDIIKNNEEFWVVYIGTFGKMYDLETALKSAGILKKYRDIRFFIVGDGPEYYKLNKLKKQSELTNLSFIRFMSLEKLIPFLKNADVGLNTTSDRNIQTIPNKLYDYMFCRLPIINSRGGEIERLIKNNKIGLQYNAGDCESLANAILNVYKNPTLIKKMGYNARMLVKKRFDRRKIYGELITFFEKIISKA